MNAHDEVRKCLDDLRAHIVKITKRPIDPDVDHYTDEISTLTASYMIPCVAVSFDDVGLTHTQRRFMDLIVSRRGQTFTKEAFMNALYFDRPGDEPAEKIIDVFACHIRHKLLKAKTPYWIETVWGLGYRYVDVPAVEGVKKLQSQLRNHSHYGMPSDVGSGSLGARVLAHITDDGERY